jgi:hypothetical protein
MNIVREGEWGQQERGLNGYEDHGESEGSAFGTLETAEGAGSLISQPDAEPSTSGASQGSAPPGQAADASDDAGGRGHGASG